MTTVFVPVLKYQSYESGCHIEFISWPKQLPGEIIIPDGLGNITALALMEAAMPIDDGAEPLRNKPTLYVLQEIIRLGSFTYPEFGRCELFPLDMLNSEVAFLKALGPIINEPESPLFKDNVSSGGSEFYRNYETFLCKLDDYKDAKDE